MLALFPKGLERPVVFAPGAVHLAELLRSVLIGWPMRLERDPAPRALLRISSEGDEIVIERPEDGAIFREPTAVSAVCSLVVEIVDALAATTPDLVCLHAAAAEFNGRLVLFPASHRAGKSTLMARLSAGGRRIFADDIMPFDLAAGEAVSTGCLPRLRLPLPRSASRTFRNRVHNRTVLSDGYYAYLSASKGAEVGFGERLPFGAVVLLERSDRPVEARLEPAPLDKALLEILMRNTRGDRNAQLLLSTFVAIIRDVPVQRLIYSDLEDAVRCLEVAFAEWTPAPRIREPRDAETHCGASEASAGPTIELPTPKIGTPIYCRSPSVTLERVDASGFLLNTRDDSIHVLDLLGLGVWHLLETPRDASSLVDIVAHAFPETPYRKVADDIDRLLSALVGEGLIDEVDAGCPGHVVDERDIKQSRSARP